MSDAVDPLVPLTENEKKLIAELSKLPREEILQSLKDDLQTAAWIELATIPIYLYTYYSIERIEKSGENIRPSDLFANKAGGMIMSVAVEEMLHMSLACNILYSLGVDPKLYQHSPGPYPTPLPYHNPTGPPGPGGSDKVLIPLGKFSYDQLWHCLQIEYPEKMDAIPQDRNWDTIGQFYSYIRCLIMCPQIRDEDFQVRGKDSTRYQIQPYNYSPNNIDTAHPSQPFNPWGMPPVQPATEKAKSGSEPTAAEAAVFSNFPDSHAGPTSLLTVSCRLSALQAIGTICDQGEGFEHRPTDNPSRTEDSHYYKFLTLQAQLEEYPGHVEKLAPLPSPPCPIEPTVTKDELAKVVLDFPDNPTTAGYDSEWRPFSDLVNGVYQYMLILTETTFKVPDTGAESGGQKLFFNEAMHRTMIWVLDKLILTMQGHKIGQGQHLAPTFENIDLGHRKDAYRNLMKLAEATKCCSYYSDLESYIEIIKTVPNVTKYWRSPNIKAAERGPRAPKERGPGQPVPKPYPYRDAPTWPSWGTKQIGTQSGDKPLHACMGLNSCRASDRFGIEGPTDGPNPGVPNDCAGQGYCSTAGYDSTDPSKSSDHTCHVQNDCKHQGGCGLYGTAEELNSPGLNECKSLGSCATPINAERFSTNGPNQGKSVWARARAVFAENWPELKKQVKGAPEDLGPVPDPFADTGPPYLWISDDNVDRGNMTSCGSSGLSGAGGCG